MVAEKYFTLWWTAIDAANKDTVSNAVIKDLLSRQSMQGQIVDEWKGEIGNEDLAALEVPTADLKAMLEQHLAKVSNTMSTHCSHGVDMESTCVLTLC